MQLVHCVVEWTDYGCVTYFPNGLEASAWPTWENTHYHIISHRTGYGDDLLAYCREHDFCHSFVEQVFHNRASRVLMGIARGTALSGKASVYEEWATQNFQRWLRTNERPILSGVDWDNLKQQALRMLDELNKG